MNFEWEVEELAYRAMGKTDDEMEEEVNNGDIDQAIYDRYEIGFDTYCDIVRDLIKFTQPIKTELTETRYHAFVDNEAGRMICRIEI